MHQFRHSSGILFQMVMVCIFLISIQGGVVGQDVFPCVPELIDDSCVNLLPGIEKTDPHDEFRACIQCLKLVIFKNGTQIDELDSVRTTSFLAAHPGLFFTSSPQAQKKESRTGFSNYVAKLWGKESLTALLFNREAGLKQKFHSTVRLGEWPKGVTIEEGFIAAGPTIGRNTLNCSAVGKIWFIYIGAGYEHTTFYGSLSKRLSSQKDGHYHSHTVFWTLGVPFVRYGMKLSKGINPEYLWFEEDIIGVMEKRVQGSILIWPESHKGNISHSVYFHAGYLDLELMLNPRQYRLPILSVAIDNVPTLFGTWGASLTKASDIWMPGAWLSLPRFDVFSVNVRKFSFPFSIQPLKVHFYYWNPRRFNVGGSVKVHLGYNKR